MTDIYANALKLEAVITFGVPSIMESKLTLAGLEVVIDTNENIADFIKRDSVLDRYEIFVFWEM